MLLANTSAQPKSLLYSLEHAARSIGFYMNLNKTKFIYFNEDATISSLNDKRPKLVDQFMCHGSNISFSVSDVSIYLLKTWTATDRLMIILISNLSDRIKWEFFQIIAVSVLLYS